MAFIWQISVVEFNEGGCTISGVILSGNPPILSKHITKNFRRVLSSYFKKPFSNKQILLFSGERKFEATTDDHGGFMFQSSYQLQEDFKVYDASQISPLKIPQTYPVFFHDSKSSIAVISDIDDTILVSNTASLWKRINTLLFVPPDKRQPISYTQRILDAVNSKNGRIFYVSKSESNLFGLLISFMISNHIPQGVLNLAPYLKLKQLLNPKKGKDYKERVIRSIIEHSPGKQFILMGDDTQLDMAVYSRIADLFPQMILKIYIRKTKKNLLGNKKDHLNNLKDKTVPFTYFSDTDDVSDEVLTIKNY